jgi:hypothetical protein
MVDQVLSGVPLRLLTHDLVEAGVGGPVLGRLSRRRDHPGHQGQHRDRKARGDQRRGETSERLGGDHQVVPVPDGADHGVGVLSQSRRVIVAWQVGGEGVMAGQP